MKIVRYGTLLEQAHQRGIRKVATLLVQAPAEDNGWTAIVSSVVEMEDGACFSGLGDASPQSVKKPLVPHIVRMAETRSKARAFKDALGISAVSLEELGDDDDVLDQEPDNVHPLPGRRGRTRSPVSAAQLRYLRRLYAQRGVHGSDLDRAICEAAGVDEVRDLDRHVASALIDELKQAGGA
jgi:hypothetical protein